MESGAQTAAVPAADLLDLSSLARPPPLGSQQAAAAPPQRPAAMRDATPPPGSAKADPFAGLL